jgi:hypothetical protein
MGSSCCRSSPLQKDVPLEVFQVFIKDVNAKTSTFVVDSKDTVATLKQRFRVANGVVDPDLRLVLDDSDLKDHALLSDYGLGSPNDMRIIHCMFRLR